MVKPTHCHRPTFHRPRGSAFRAAMTMLAALVAGVPTPAVAQTGPMVFEDFGRCEAAFPDQIVTSAAIEPFSCELTCGVDGVIHLVPVNDCKAQRIFQKSAYTSGPAADPLLNLEYQTVLDVLDEHELPQGDMDKIRRVMSYARGSVRALVYATVVDIAAMDPALRTEDEQAIAEVYADELHSMRIAAAEFSLAELDRWLDTGCDYIPPESFTYEPDPFVCDSAWTFNDLFDTILPPTFDEFVAYGAANNAKELTQGNAAIATSEAAHASQFVATAVALGIAVVATFAASVAVVAAAGSIFPFIGTSAAIAASAQTMLAAAGGAGAVSAAAAGGAATAAIAVSAGVFAVVAVLVAIIASILQGYYVFTAAELPDQLAEFHQQAVEQRPFLADVVANEENSNELFIAVMRSTLPSLYDLNGPDEPPSIEWFAPIPSPPGRTLVVTDLEFVNGEFIPIPGTETVLQSFQFMPWHDDPFFWEDDPDSVVGDWSAQVSDGWFVLSRPMAEQTATSMRLAIDRMGGDFTDWVTWIVGDRFLHHQRGGHPADGQLSDTMFFLTPDGQPRQLSFSPDPTPPEVAAIVDGTPGDNGWYVSDVTLQWDIFEPDSEVSEVNGCTDATITADGTGTFSCGVLSQGGATAESVTIRRDANPPSLTVEVTPKPNEAGWTTENTTTTFTCGDFGPSGPIPNSICDTSFTVISETTTEGKSFSRSASDLAGNSVTETVTLKVDKTAPTITASSDASPNPSGWNNRDVTVSFDCDDALSGIETCPALRVLSDDGVNLSVGGNAVDVAGNTASASVAGINIDKSPPQIFPIPEPAANGSGWNNQPVQAKFLCLDVQPSPLIASGVKSCTAASLLSEEGAGQTVEGTATDNADNESTTSLTANIDLTAPTISDNVSPGSNAAGWHAVDVVVSFACDDALSGVVECTGDGVLGEGVGQTVPGSAKDAAGNTNTAIAGPINVDKTPPVVEIASPPATVPVYLLHQVVPADWSAGDGLSGLDTTIAPNAPGEPIDTSTAGERRFEVMATDFAGNNTTLGHDYIVLSPAEAIGDIVTAIDGLVADGSLKSGQAKGLTRPLNNAVRSIDKDKLVSACNQLADFVAEVEAKSPKPLDTASAAELTAQAQAIATVSLACHAT